MNRRNRGKPSCGTENPTSHGTVTVRLRLLSVRVQLQEEYLKARAEWDLLEHSLTESAFPNLLFKEATEEVAGCEHRVIVIPSIQGLADGVCIGPSSVERCRCEGC
ncbi:hypothetical protein BLNAU_24939 [Blattamonas nauphoetae]|uniref:Uncharacterized protein n=1 Tax=Blattamonas nauphoetae TaxID=2049346 RepID=A0ABQ9WL02_9EUKA|nr:hypothetical protein BLNAU_24939 [Blattamonas nauphoetae]